jgi:hypothetical protein
MEQSQLRMLIMVNESGLKERERAKMWKCAVRCEGRQLWHFILSLINFLDERESKRITGREGSNVYFVIVLVTRAKEKDLPTGAIE